MNTKLFVSYISVAVLFLFLTFQSAFGATIYVDVNGTGDYLTIQSAVDAATTGDIIIVKPGVYTGSGSWDINFQGKAIVLQSQDPDDHQIVQTTIIDCNDQGHYGFVFNSGETTQTILAGFSITNTTNGAIWCENQSSPTIRNCSLYANKGSQVIMCRGSSPHIIGCVINENQTSVAVECIFQPTGPSSIIASNPTIERCSISYNAPGGGMDITNSSPIIRNTSITGNYDFGVEGQNSASDYPDFGFTPLFENCLIAGNWDSEVSFASFSNGSINATFKNCTITSTMGCAVCDGGGAGIKLSGYENAIVRLENCVVSHNSLYQGGSGFPQIWLGGEPKIIIDYSNIQGGQTAIDAPNGGTVVWGVGNLDIDPNYIDSGYWLDPIPGEYYDDTWVEGNYRLNHVSKCIDAGDNSLVSPDSNDMDGDGNTTEPIPYDLDYHPRIVAGDCNSTDVVDMGAYEFSYISLGDFAGGCDVDFADFAVLASAWLTEKGQAGYDPNCDIAIPLDNKIDAKDLRVFIDNWLLNK